MFSHLFLSKNIGNSKNKSSSSIGIISRVKNAVSLALGITTITSSVATGQVSTPTPLHHPQEISTPAISSSRPINSPVFITRPPVAPIVDEKKETPLEPISLLTKLRIATANRGDSVEFFMLSNFGTKDGWELLVEKESGNRVRIPSKDLIAGKTYVLARDEKEAINLTNIFKKQTTKKIEVSKNSQHKKLTKKNTLSYNQFAASEEDFLSIAKKVGLPLSSMPKALALFATIGQHESGTRYEASGINIRNKKSVHYGTRAIGRYQIMPYNKVAWSQKHFSTVLPLTPENQDKIAFAEMAERISSYSRNGLEFPTIVKEIAADWYGRGRAMSGQPTTEEYSNMIAHMYKKIAPNFSPVFAAIDKATSLAHIDIKDTSIGKQNKTQSLAMNTTSSNKTSKKVFSTVSANDEKFNSEKSKLTIAMADIDNIQLDSKEITKTATVDLVSVGEIKNVIRSIIEDTPSVIDTTEDLSIGKQYQEESLKKLKNTPGVRPELMSQFKQLTKATDFVAYYKTNILHQEKLLSGGNERQKDMAKKILPGLYTLLGTIESQIIIASNDERITLKKAA